MQRPVDEHQSHHVKLTVAMVKTRLTGFFRIPEPASITEPGRKAYVAIARAQELATRQVLNHVDICPFHD